MSLIHREQKTTKKLTGKSFLSFGFKTLTLAATSIALLYSGIFIGLLGHALQPPLENDLSFVSSLLYKFSSSTLMGISIGLMLASIIVPVIGLCYFISISKNKNRTLNDIRSFLYLAAIVALILAGLGALILDIPNLAMVYYMLKFLS